ncbi:MAG: hypothetical protein VR68_11515 [Peptococcaceae bacterium BRH_c4a]|nr:MAG: hypothetical protein VR68_11515 [Peptococcaceae bacterium BRH_c4a]
MNNNKKDDSFKETIDLIKHTWRHRAGQEIPAAILDTVDVLWPEPKPRPLLTHKKKNPGNWHMIFTLPPGLSYRDVVNRQEYFADACRGYVEIKKVAGYVHMTVRTGHLENHYPYLWPPDEHKGYKKMALPVPIGYSPAPEVLDLAEAPHLLVAGVTGFGKSNFLLVLIHSLMSHAKIAIIDLKRLQFSYLKNHCALAKNEKDALALMRALNREMERRIDILEAAGVEKIQEYHGTGKAAMAMDYIVLVIDEVAEISDPEIIRLIDRIVRLARATGISVVAATQRPSKKVPVFRDDTRDMFSARLCYLMPDEISSRLVLGETCSMAAQLPEIKGRGVYKFGVTIKEVQTMYLPVKQAKKLIEKQEGVVWDVTQSRKRIAPR